MQVIKDEILFFDGAMGSMLQSRGLQLRELPETLNLTKPDLPHRLVLLFGELPKWLRGSPAKGVAL